MHVHVHSTVLRLDTIIGMVLLLPVPRPPTGGGLNTPKIYGTGASINFGPPCLQDKIRSAMPKNHRHGAGILHCRADILVCVNGVLMLHILS